MDRSVDSIGSCSLDVDADSSDISDASSSVQILVNDMNRDITTKLQEDSEKLLVHNIVTARHQTRQANIYSEAAGDVIESHLHEGNSDKKPSYLNLACCVNGYSNLTTYDSKIRQDINKSREVSPIRPSSNSMQYCKLSNAPVPPVLIPLPTNVTKSLNGKLQSASEANNNHTNNKTQNDNHETEEPRNLSFVQQRVERLYGPGALAQNFYSPRKVRGCNTFRKGDISDKMKTEPPTELQLKFQELSPNKEKKLKRTVIAGSCARPVVNVEIQNAENNSVDLPVFRHLSSEFRAQLPKISPKRNGTNRSPSNKNSNGIEGDAVHSDTQLNSDEVDHKTVTSSIKEGDLVKDINILHFEKNKNVSEKDGKYFLTLLKNQESRILSLADTAEKYLELLSNNAEISEDVLGLLRSASGKARLLVSQKMKQFEGLCHNNLKSTPVEKFPTTADDLQGFWDMVYLQIDHIDLIFSEIESLKANNWKKSVNASVTIEASKQNKNFKAKTVKSKVPVSNGNTKSQIQSEISLKREAQRKQLLEIKRKNKMALNTQTNNTINEANSLSLDPFLKNQTNG